MRVTRSRRRLFVAPQVAVAVLFLLPGVSGKPAPAVSHAPCLVKNPAGGGVTHSLQSAVDAAAPNDLLVVRGTCVGSTIVDKSLTITGLANPGLGSPVLDGQNGGTVLRIGLEPPTPIEVVISRLTITHGSAHAGGGIVNFGTLSLSYATVTRNAGGGILNEGLGLMLDHSSVTGNVSDFRGGGITNRSTMTLTDSAVATNTAVDGGGVWSDGFATLRDSSVTGNSARGDGGGVFNLGALDSEGSIIRGNTSEGNGGGINSHSVLMASDTTISGNTASFGGGGIYNSFAGTGSLSVSNVTENTSVDVLGRGSNVGGGIADCSSQLSVDGSASVADNHPDDFGTAYC